MRLEITRRSDLATRALVELGRSGRRTKSEELGLGNHEFTPGQIGAVM